MRTTILLILLAALTFAPASMAADDDVLFARSHTVEALFAYMSAAEGGGDALFAPTYTADDLETSGDPDSFVLSAAYPNPFNPRTSFSLRVEDRQQVTVQVFNLLGVPVKELFSGVMDAGESRTFTFTAEDLPSGIYLYRVQGESFTATRQMTLLK